MSWPRRVLLFVVLAAAAFAALRVGVRRVAPLRRGGVVGEVVPAWFLVAWQARDGQRRVASFHEWRRVGEDGARGTAEGAAPPCDEVAHLAADEEGVAGLECRRRPRAVTRFYWRETPQGPQPLRWELRPVQGGGRLMDLAAGLAAVALALLGTAVGVRLTR